MLSGWKVIAGYLRRDERTAMRWATERGMPVHRTPGRGRGTVYAIPAELDAWFAADRELAAEARREASVSPEPALASANAPNARPGLAPRRWWQSWWAAGASVASGLCFVAAGAFTLDRSIQTRASPAPSFTDPAAKALFLQADYDWNLRTPASLLRARQEYSDAIGRDPGVAAAYVGLANTYLLLREFGTMPETDAYGRAEAAARTAISLAPESAEAHRALAFVTFWWRQDRATARQEFVRAVELKPDDPLTLHWYATALHANGEPVAALKEINAARDIDPTSTAILTDRGAILYAAGQRAEGLAVLRGVVREQPAAISAHRQLAQIALVEGRPEEFIREAGITAQLRGDAVSLTDIKRWSAAGPDNGKLLALMLTDARRAHAGWYRIADLTAAAGRVDEAKDALAQACKRREPDTVGALADIMLRRSLSREDITARCNRPALMAS